MGWLYTRLVASNSFAPEYRADDGHEEQASDSEEENLIAPSSPIPPQSRLNNSIQEFMAMSVYTCRILG
jgi:hypothetical protein